MSTVGRDVSAGRFVAVATLANLLLFQQPLYRYALDHLDLARLNGWLTFFTLLVVVGAFTAVLLSLLLSLLVACAPALARPLCALAALASACAVYFVSTYRVILDRSMMGNVLNTRSEESLDFLHPALALHVLLLGVPSLWALWRWRIAPVRRLALLGRAVAMVAALLAVAYLNSSTWLWFDQHAKRLGGLIMPWSWAFNTVRALHVGKTELADLELLPPAVASDEAPLLVVLVIGETARAANFSLYGYERDTNPQLAAAGVTIVPGARACSTYTTASLHCLLSHDGARSGRHEILPSYLQRHGIEVVWRTDNWGEPPMRVATYEKASALRRGCEGERCAFDEVLLEDLEERVRASASARKLAVLHTKGSHGPAYHARYPADFDVFEPVCRSVELASCNAASLINAYDNSILYTDDFLARTIALLERMDDVPSIMIYVSDHGESLGEYGLYLHGTPYSIAPDVQKDIPFIVWTSSGVAGRKAVHLDDVPNPDPDAHARVFHSVLGAFGLTGPVYDRRLDLFAPPDQVGPDDPRS